jgi:hypothetical protein
MQIKIRLEFRLLLFSLTFISFFKCSSSEEIKVTRTDEKSIIVSIDTINDDIRIYDTVYLNVDEIKQFSIDTSFNYFTDVENTFRHILPDSVLIKMTKSKNLKIRFLASLEFLKKETIDKKIIYSNSKIDSVLGCFCDELIIIDYNHLTSMPECDIESMCEKIYYWSSHNIDSISNFKNISKINRKWLNLFYPKYFGSRNVDTIHKYFKLPKNITYPYKYGSSKSSNYFLPPIEDEILNDLNSLKHLYYMRKRIGLN